MSDQNSPSSFDQIAIGNDNIQVVGSHNVIQRITNFFHVDTEQQRAQRNRRAMLELMKNTWVKGVLEKSLYHDMRIELGLEERSGAVGHPWDMTVRMPNRPNHPLPPGTRIIDVFDESNCALLILGEPGSGKTTMLLELARDSIARAENDFNQPIPVVLNLSSWSDPKQSIADWLGSELGSKYFIHEKIATAWIENEELLLLLDGLDEVRLDLRDACVKAINGFRQEHGATAMAVCCRIVNYEQLPTQIKLQSAVVVQPLTNQQVEQYLANVGPKLVRMRDALQNDSTLQELAQSPLMLSIMAMAYQDKAPGTKTQDDPQLIGARRADVFDAYIRHTLQRVGRSRNEIYPEDQTIGWLAWLARKMSEHSQSIFFLERIRPAWLETRSQKMQYRVMVLLISGLSGALVLGLGGMLILTPLMLSIGLQARNMDAALYNDLIGGMVVGLGGGLLGGLVGMVVGLFIELLRIDKPTEVFKWSWKRAILGFFPSMISKWHGVLGAALLFGPLGGLTVGLVGMAVSGLRVSWPNSLFILFFLELVCGLVGGLVGALVGGLTGGLYVGELEKSTTPNQGTRQSLKNAVAIARAFGLVVGLSGGLPLLLINVWLGVTIDTTVLIVSVAFGLIFGLSSALFLGLMYGGMTAVRHYALRLLLSRSGRMSLNYVRFLDYAAERIFLRRVGGGYIFVHRLLQDHFAAMKTDTHSATK